MALQRVRHIGRRVRCNQLKTCAPSDSFVATKLEAFVSRGDSDILSSHDLEDILNVIDGRPSIVDEMTAATDALQGYVGE